MEYIEYRHNKGSRDKRILVLLHGYGSNEHDLPGLGSALSSDCTLLSLRAPIDLPFGGHAWLSLYPQEKGFKADIPEALKALDRLEQLLEELMRYLAELDPDHWRENLDALIQDWFPELADELRQRARALLAYQDFKSHFGPVKFGGFLAPS